MSRELHKKVIKVSDGSEHNLYYERGPEMRVSHLASKAHESKPGALYWYVNNEIPVKRNKNGDFVAEDGEIYR